MQEHRAKGAYVSQRTSAGVLLVTPGSLSDIVALVLAVPPLVQQVMARRSGAELASKLT